MSTFGDDQIQSLGEAIDYARGDGPAIHHLHDAKSGSETSNPYTVVDDEQHVASECRITLG